MRLEDIIRNEYFDWLFNIVSSRGRSESISYERLLMELHSIDFKWLLDGDSDRAEDGISLRYRFSLRSGYDEETECLDGPCSVLEMMIALAIRWEEDFMDDPLYGNRTGQWFWQMIVSLGLGSMTDERFDRRYVQERIDIFLNREYEPNGDGGLFTIRNCRYDLRDVEIWYQLNWYIDHLNVM